MKTFARLIAALSVLVATLCEAQAPATALAGSYPTTKVLAIGSLAAPLTVEQRQTILSKEVPDTVRLYLAGKIDQWFSRQDGKGVVFVLNVTSVEEAHSLLEALPLGQAHLMTFELMPLGPLVPLTLLLRQP